MLHFLRQHKLFVLWSAITAYVLTFFYFTWAKLSHFGYDNLDLAIFNSSIFNLAHGSGLANAIHPPSYWGDHASPILYLLAPLYSIAPVPLTLLWLQVLLLALCVWPLYLIARRKLTETKSIIVCLLWLVNPVLHNMTVFEFSLVPLAMFFLLWSWYWYEQKSLWLWLVFSLLALACREDISFVILMYGLVAWWDKRSWSWRLLPVLIGLSWFAFAQYVIRQIVLSGSYKFSLYYLWIFQSDFLALIKHFISWGNVELILGMLFPLFFLPLARPKLLLLLVPPLASMVLSYSGGNQMVLKSHYGGLLLWPLFLALIYWLPTGQLPKKIRLYFPHNFFVYGLLLLASVYASLTYGSILAQSTREVDGGRVLAYNQAVSQIPATAGVASTYSFMSNLSSRQTIQLLPYAYAGRGQFALTEYQLDPMIDYLVIDWQEMIYAQAHYPSRYPSSVSHQSMQSNWQSITQDFTPIWQSGTVMIMKRQTTSTPLASVQPSTSSELTMILEPRSDSEYRLTVDGPLPPAELYLEASQGDQLWRWPLGYSLYEPSKSTSTLSIVMPIVVPAEFGALTNLKLYSWKEASLRLNELNSLSASWPDQKLLLEQNL